MTDELGREREVATLAGGCFWCLEAVYAELRGIELVEPGYSGGLLPHPTYEHVCTGTTGHAEVVRLTFDPGVISFKEILDVFFTIHDATTLNRQGYDVGTQYRSVIFYHSPEQKEIAERMIAELDAAKIWPAPIVTAVQPAPGFYPAEEYHRDYFRRHPEQAYCQVVVAPKVAKARQHFMEKFKRADAVR